MSLRLWLSFLILPVFLGLGLAGSALLVHLEGAEWRWGLEQRQGAAVTAAAQFLKEAPDPVAELRRASVTWTLRSVLDRPGALRSLYLLTPDGRQVLAEVGRKPAPFIAAPAGEAPGSASQPRLLPPRRDDQGWIASAYALVDAGPVSGDGRRAFIVGADIDAAPYRAALAALGRVVAAILAASLGLGVASSLLLAGLMRRGLAQLTATAQAAADPEQASAPGAASIRELSDLGLAIDLTVRNLAGKAQALRESILVAEKLRRVDDGPAYLNALVPPGIEACCPGFEVAARMLGDGTGGGFLEAVRLEAGVAIVLGRLSGKRVDVGAVSAVRSLARQCLGREAMADLLAQVRALFAVEGLCGVEWNESTRTLRLYEDGEEPTTLVPEEGTRLVHRLGAEGASRAEAYGALYADLPPRQMIEDLAAVLGLGAQGPVVAFCRPSGNSIRG